VSHSNWFDEQFASTRVMVILRGLEEHSLDYATRAWDAGATMLEIPIQTSRDVDALRQVAAAARERGLTVGAGTVTSVELVELARAAGAAYTVSPGTDDNVIRASHDADLPSLPGVATASEIQRCLRHGIRWMKAFPATSLGAPWLTSMHGPFPEVDFVATGGITPSNSEDFLAAGARAVGLSLSPARPEQWARLAQLAASR
jgi:Entner-Doudoroff aldolase